MLQDKYLPVYHFSEKHQITICTTPEKVYPFIRRLDFSSSHIIQILFRIRGIPTSAGQGIGGLEKMGFCVLEEEQNCEIILGLIGQFWRFSGNIQRCTPLEFEEFEHADFAKTTWNFTLKKVGVQSILQTETRICCPNEQVRKKFERYWLLIRPFSGIIRKEILKSIKAKVELEL